MTDAPKTIVSYRMDSGAVSASYIRTDAPELAALVEALAWYADGANHEGHFNVNRQRCDPSLVDEDDGEKARAAVAAWDALLVKTP